MRRPRRADEEAAVADEEAAVADEEAATGSWPIVGIAGRAAP
jgi:hypothetical protein